MNTKKNTMIPFRLLLAFLLLTALFQNKMMANTNYDTRWKSVEALEDKGKTKDAQQAVEVLLSDSRKEANTAHTIKALLYKYRYQLILEEDAEWKIVQDVKKEIAQAKGAEKAVLNSILAELYWQYFNENSWKFADRTETDSLQSEDFRTWDLKTLFKTINSHYLASLQEPALLQQTALEQYIPLLAREKGSEVFRPTLYDLLAHRAIDFFNEDKSNLTEPANAFAIDDKKYFVTAADFVRLTLSDKQPDGQEYLALRLFQELLNYKLNNRKTLDELADADLKRLQYVRAHYVNKDEANLLYFEALRSMKQAYAKCNTAATIDYQMASYIVQLVGNATANGSALPQGIKGIQDALDICNAAIKNYPNTKGAENCAALKLSISQKNITLTTEAAVVPQLPFKASVSYKNIGKIYLKVVPLKYKDKDAIFDLKAKETDKDVIRRLNAISPVKKWSQSLPASGDYQDHNTEIKIDGLNPGFYVLMASTHPGFSIENGNEAVSVVTLFATNISYVSNENANKDTVEIYVLDRNSGQPLEKAKVQFYKNEYDYKSRKYIRTEIGTAVSDANGRVTKVFTKKEKEKYYNEYFFFDITHKSDFYPVTRSQYHYYYPRKETPQTNQQVHLFTDRSIYRPGQQIFVKGIALQQTSGVDTLPGNSYVLLTNHKVTVTLKDVNYQDVAQQEFTTNEYGSFTGVFTAPVTGLMGRMTLSTPFGSEAVQVEEYKRPKFEATFLPVEKAYNLNDTVVVTGKAVSYAGANIDGAEVKYTVRRVAQFPVWCWWGWRKPWFPQSSEKIIATGNAVTDSEGKFDIRFQAMPDLTIDQTMKPYFNYEITADVVDINGETHSANTTVRVGYLAIDAEVSVAEAIKNTKENTIRVSTNNLNGQPEPTAVTIKIFRLKTPDYPKKKRDWNEPDQFVMTKEEHEKWFPYDVYDKEDLMSNWTKGSLVKTYAFNTKDQQQIVLPAGELAGGAYLLEFFCKDKNGNEINISKNFIALSEDEQKPVTPVFVDFSTNKSTVKPGETLEYSIASSLQDVRVMIEIAYKGKLIDKQFVRLQNEIKSFRLPVSEDYLGGLEISYVAVVKNRSYTGSRFIHVPYEDKSLKIEWITFRDKLLPGQKEEWKLKISGKDKEKVSAELLATMYDASLDAFLPHGYSFSLSQPYFNGYLGIYSSDAFGTASSSLYPSKNWNPYKNYVSQAYDALNLFGLQFGYNRYRYKTKSLMFESAAPPQPLMAADAVQEAAGMAAKMEIDLEMKAMSAKKADTDKKSVAMNMKEQPSVSEESVNAVVPRTNFNETAFFIPQINTDEEGNIILSFQMPEALTKWNFLGFAHTKELKYQYFTKSAVTQKELMVTPNAPRFLREGDQFSFSTKITNLSDKDLKGTATLVLYDAVTMKEITAELLQQETGVRGKSVQQTFEVGKGLNTALSWNLHIPAGITAVTYKVLAQADNFTDGEQATLMVLPNRMLVTESLPLWVRGNSKKSYTFNKLLKNTSTTLQHYQLTLEMSSQPVWYAVQALPYMMEYPYECAEQIFSRYYANTLATHIANAQPKFKSVFEKWKMAGSEALISNLEKNPELKAVLLEETPWVRDAQDETEQKKRIGLLFDLSRMANEQDKAFDKLLKMQTPNGGFIWFPGMPDNRYITQHIIAGFGHLAHLKTLGENRSANMEEMLRKAVSYLDDRLREDLEAIKKYDTAYQKNNHLSYNVIHALYARSFFDYAIDKKNQEAYHYFLSQEKRYWPEQGLYGQGMMALTLHRNKEKSTAKEIMTALKQNAIVTEEMGMYWKANETGGWYWYQAPVETQALLIEAFHEVAGDEKAVDELKVWLLKQKQTTSWKSTKATAEACYALLLQGKDWTASDKLVEVRMNKKVIDPVKQNAIVEAGTGYYKVNWNAAEIKPEMANIELKKSDKGPAYGAVYWQYFEDLDKITGATTSLQLNKQLFKEVSTAEGKKLLNITEQTPLQVGDVVKVRIELRTDRNLEYVHLKDLRAAGFEPINVLSQYKYQDGLGYYESTKDVATHFFIDWMQKGVYVFEYAMRATIAGNFSNGITQIESMYAPEFKSHSKGERVTILKK